MMLFEVWGAFGNEWGLMIEPSFDLEGLLPYFYHVGNKEKAVNLQERPY